MSDPMTSTEVAVEQRLVGLMSATLTLRNLNEIPEGRAVIARPKCLEEIELVRDQLSRILDDVGGK
jgi:hypothetical protein